MSDQKCHGAWFAGLACDHLYANCPNRTRSEAELRRYDLWDLTGNGIDPHGELVCGMCVHRHNLAHHKEAAS